MNSSSNDYATKVLDYFWERRDKRVDGWPLMDSPFPTMVLIVGYIYFCRNLGPRLMKNRQPFNLRKVIVAYNFMMVVANAYLHYQAWYLGWGTDYSWKCQPLDRSMSPRALKIASLVWVYYIMKYVDWFDTIFFVLRKKFSHISILHLYHHTFMPQATWIAVRFMPGGHVTFTGLLNTGVHVIMHTYYGMAACGPQFQKYLWWKRYLTILQLVQFVLIILHFMQPLLCNDCKIDLPSEWAYIFVIHGFIFIWLFSNFYKKTYITTKICFPGDVMQNGCDLKDKNH